GNAKMNYSKKLVSLAVVATAVGMIFLSCDSLSNDEEEESGALSVLLTDGPFPSDLVAEANVTIDSLDIREKGTQETTGAYTTLSREQATYNLMDLRNGVTESLVEIDVPEGVYNQIRLYISDATVILKDGQEFPLQVPSGVRTGLKIFIAPDIEVLSDITAELLLDIDVSKSFVVQGNPRTPGGLTGFLFKPVLRAVNQSIAGRLTGTVTDTATVANPIPDAQVWVELDTVISNTFTDTLSGAYQLIGLPVGTYTAKATVAGYDTVSVANVEIVAANPTTLDFALKPQPQ
ncbi:DUF4382 domain-containing protein, partial [Candidatus Neomarinimicrobiota bacterium]